MKIYYRTPGSDEPLRLLCESKEPLGLIPVSPEEEPVSHDQETVQDSEPVETISFDVNMEGLEKKMPKTKYPRKLKKAIGQMWEINYDGDVLNISFCAKSKTRWQRKALNKVRKYYDRIEFPMKDGMTLSICGMEEQL